MRRRVLIALATLAAITIPAAFAGVGIGTGGGTPGTSRHFRLIGHDALFARGMNAAPALFADAGVLYVGNRTDGQPQHPHAGILVVDVSDPADPAVVSEIGPPFAGNVNETTRELRVWPHRRLLIVLSFRCSPVIHACAGGQVTPTYRFFDLSDPIHPQHIRTYVPTQADGTVRTPHEFFLWEDPNDADRALLWESDPTTSDNPTRANMIIRDISHVPDGAAPTIVAQGNWNQFYPGSHDPANYDNDLALHSMAPTADGRVTHLAYLRGHYLALDTGEVVDNPDPPSVIDLNDNLITQVGDRPRWGAGDRCAGHTAVGCGESHTAVQVPGRPYELNVDEVYGTLAAPSFGWPWGWVRLIDIADPAHPRIVGEYKLHQNTPAYTPAPGENELNSYSSHNPTVLPRLAFDAWHSGGLQAIDINQPRRPRQAGWFSPTPLPTVTTEDPALSAGPNKVVMWSYPIISHGLIYVIDIRNGLYILEYKGPHQNAVRGVNFLEGNSNLGDAVELAD